MQNHCKPTGRMMMMLMIYIASLSDRYAARAVYTVLGKIEEHVWL